MTDVRFRPLLQSGGPRPAEALRLAGGQLWFDRVVTHEQGRKGEIIPARDLPAAVRDRLCAERAPICGLVWSRPRLMGILNVTPDSFSDGGMYDRPVDAVAQARRMAVSGADTIDVGGESTRPGSDPVSEEEEAARVVPVIKALRRDLLDLPVSIDTRKAAVAETALLAGAELVNDVSALGHDERMVEVVTKTAAPICLMHSQGDPKTMQDAPRYADVVLDVYGGLERVVDECEAAGIPRARIMVDPGIGFGKTLEHNLDLLRNLSIFHGLGCVLLVGVSRKRFIGTIGNEPESAARVPGSIAVALEALRHGAQMLRIHDVKETRQAVSLWEALNGFERRMRGSDG
jgi:dihydropteroate synthase